MSAGGLEDSSSATVKTRFLIISDTHSTSKSETFQDKSVPKADVVLHCGDLTMRGTPPENERAIALLKDLDAELKLVIAGNHDVSLHEEFYLEKGERFHRKGWSNDMPKKVMAMWKDGLGKEAGITYLEEGTHEFKLSNGARFTVYASPWQPAFADWAFNYPHQQDRWNPPSLVSRFTQPKPEHPIPDFGKVDIVMTHGPPHLHRDMCFDKRAVGCPHLLKALKRAKPRLHCFGHIHEAWGAERLSYPALDSVKLVGTSSEDQHAAFLDVSGDSAQPLKYGQETLIVNASIMNLRYRPINLPWVVDMELPRA